MWLFYFTFQKQCIKVIVSPSILANYMARIYGETGTTVMYLVWFSCFLCLNFVEVLRSVGLVFITFGKVSVTISSNNTSVFLTSSGAPLILGYLKLSHSSLFLYLYFFFFFFSFWTVSISMSSSSLNFSAAVSNV